MISDFVKGKKKFGYAQRILAGINLHRSIDEFTDDHPVNKEASKIFRLHYGLYSRAFIDVVYDHFLAVELASDVEDFEAYTFSLYKQIEVFQPVLPTHFNNIFPYMKQHNWLFNYQFAWGIEKSLDGLVHRAAYISDSKTAIELFKSRYEDLRSAYQIFFPLLKKYALEKFSDIH
jgi:acyl carrier protein phosphodiesterase